MRLLRRFLARLKNFATGRQDDQRLREEMAEHLALQTETRDWEQTAAIIARFFAVKAEDLT